MGVSENKMGLMPIRKLLINMSVPIMISMLIQALYNVVDSIFVARVNENALTAVSLVGEVSRQLVVLLPVVYILSLRGNVNLIWWAYPIAEILALVLNVVFLRFIYNKIIHPMETKEVALV